MGAQQMRGRVFIVAAALAWTVTGQLSPGRVIAGEAWIDHFISAKEAHEDGRWASCIQAVRAGRAQAPKDRKPGFAVFGARCAAHQGDREAFDAFVKAAGERMDWDEQHLLEMMILKLEAARGGDGAGERAEDTRARGSSPRDANPGRVDEKQGDEAAPRANTAR
jgi:hypothetical protein